MRELPQDWREYWRVRGDAEHRHANAAWLERCARELMLYFPDRPAATLELGCGSGDFHGFWNQRFASYVGLDFSPAMLRVFKSRWPEARLACADAAALPLAGAAFGFVFSKGVFQYLDPGRVRSSLTQAARLLAPDGTVLIADIPDAQLRLHYYAGALRGDRTTSWRAGARRLLSVKLGRVRDDLGHWYGRCAFARLAGECGFACATFSSSSYEYRFHALLRKS